MSGVSALSASFSAVCLKGYNYYNKSRIGNITVYKGLVPYASSGRGYLSVDTSSGSKYSDYTFHLKKGALYNNFWPIDMRKNFRFYFKIFYESDDVPTNRTIFVKNYATKPSNYISATINLDNISISKTVYSVNIKTGLFFFG